MERIRKFPGDHIYLGRQGEHLNRQIVFDISAWEEKAGPQGRVQLLYRRPGESAPYPVELEREEGGAVWSVTAADTALSGSGGGELRYCLGEQVVKSAVSVVTVEAAMGTAGQAPQVPGSTIPGGSGVKLDETLTRSGYAAEAKAVGQAVDGVSAMVGDLSRLNTTDKSSLVNAINEILAAGGGTEEPQPPAVTTRGIVWDLVNVTGSNAAVSVQEGASLTAVLTAEEGYILGDVTVTMGGEVLTGVWDAATATVTIPRVTGDVVISCAGVKESAGEPADTSPVIAQTGMKIMNDGSYQAAATLCVTRAYEYSWDRDALKAHPQYSAADGFFSLGGYQGAIEIFIASEKHVAAGNSILSADTDWGNIRMNYCADGGFVIAKNCYESARDGVVVSIPVPNKNSAMCQSDVVSSEFTLFAADVEGSYAYWSKPYDTAILPMGVNAGDIIFAGKDSPYYGMKNIDGTMLSEASVAELSYDEDYAQDYGIATTSLLGDDPAAGADVYAGVSDDFAAVINTAKKEWMTRYGGDYRKIPLIVSTDQHGRTSGIFNLLSRILNMHDVSKICNLGDTVTDKWYDGEPDKPLLTCSELDKWMECMKTIPFSKRLDVFGNHDAWYGNGTAGGNAVGTAYPSNLSHLDQYFRNIYARRTNNSGWFAVRDDYFNVKYVVITGLEWVNGSGTYRIGTEQMKFIIDEFGKDDGYDIVVVSHVPVYYQDSTETFPTGMTPETPGSTAITRVSTLNTDLLFNARKNKTAGTITDSEGVEHTFDFSGCGTDILCALHGHMHVDGYNYVGGDGLLSAAFDWFPYETFFLVLIDRVERKLDVWKLSNTPQSLRYQIPLDKPAG